MKQQVGILFLVSIFGISVNIYASLSNSGEDLDISSNKLDTIKVADAFDFPVGPPDAKGYYNAQGFGKNNHLGDDWNANSGGNTDLGDTIYSIANGIVSFAKDVEGGWGNVIRIVHVLPDGGKVESLYAHCDEILTKKGDLVNIGEPIGTIGDAHGIYYAHLHLEIRDEVGLPLGGVYSSDTDGYVDPTVFINNH